MGNYNKFIYKKINNFPWIESNYWDSCLKFGVVLDSGKHSSSRAVVRMELQSAKDQLGSHKIYRTHIPLARPGVLCRAG